MIYGYISIIILSRVGLYFDSDQLILLSVVTGITAIKWI